MQTEFKDSYHQVRPHLDNNEQIEFKSRLINHMFNPKFFFPLCREDCLTEFSNHEQIKQFYQEIDNIHTDIKFTYELEENGKILFFEVFVEKSNQSFISTAYEKTN